VAKTLNENEIETEIIQTGDKDIRGCMGCCKCDEIKRCVFDDLVNEIAAKLAECDGIVIGSPVYYASANGSIVSLLDRLFYSTFDCDKTMKVGAAVVSARRAGCTAAFDVLNKYFTISGMPIASSQYWNMVHGNSPEEVLKDEEGLQIMRTLGRNMAFLTKSIALGKNKFGLPEKEQRVFTNFINSE
jgi:multimeric flavodoxin WrbA